ncbi:MAG TPA: SIMPL domain-containing protein [Candidatus Bilamarchaeum sp.]|nr:SIMPL domain-containing protein [Candidatus Bilamarchaeum sp.]
MAENNSMLVIGVIVIVLITAGLTYFIAKSGDTSKLNLTGDGKPTITVRGEATKSVMPDLLTIGLSVVGNGSTVSESQAEASTKMAAIKAALLAKGVKESDIQTTSFYTQPVYNTTCKYPVYDKPIPVEPDGGIGTSSTPGTTEPAMMPDYYPYPYCQSGEIIGYTTTHSITVETEKTNEGGSLIDAATKNDSARFDYVYFSLKEATRIAAEEELQGKAAAAAKAKAAKIAEGVGSKLGKLVSINPDQYYYPYPMYGGRDMMAGSESAAPPTELFPSETTLSSSMIVVYEIEQ